MAQYSKGRFLEIKEDQQQVYKDGKPVEGEFKKRIRVLFMPSKPDSMWLNVTDAPIDVIQASAALVGVDQDVMFPSRIGVFNDVPFLSLATGATIDDFSISQKLPPLRQKEPAKA
ncbi:MULTISPECIES: hypothetical protein [Methylobacter]